MDNLLTQTIHERGEFQFFFYKNQTEQNQSNLIELGSEFNQN